MLLLLLLLPHRKRAVVTRRQKDGGPTTGDDHDDDDLAVIPVAAPLPDGPAPRGTLTAESRGERARGPEEVVLVLVLVWREKKRVVVSRLSPELLSRRQSQGGF